MDRRKFFRSVVQGGIFSSLALLTTYLVFKEKPIGSENCDFDFVCQNCGKNRHCQLPEASKFRLKNRKNIQNHG